MKLILCVVLIITIICWLSFLIIKQTKDLEKQFEDLQLEGIEQNKRLIALEKRVKQLETGSIDEKRDSCRENKTSYKPIRRNR